MSSLAQVPQGEHERNVVQLYLSADVKATFDAVLLLVLNWDGEITEGFTDLGRNTVDRLPIRCETAVKNIRDCD